MRIISQSNIVIHNIQNWPQGPIFTHAAIDDTILALCSSALIYLKKTTTFNVNFNRNTFFTLGVPTLYLSFLYNN